MSIDFLIIGAQKAGTTSLDRYLSQHLQVCTAPQKEVHFFDLKADWGQPWYESQFPIDRGNPFEVNVRVGEATPYYLFHPAVPERVDALYPDVKLIVLLRDPVERAISHYQHARRLGLETLEFDAAIAAEPERLAGEAMRLLTDETATSFSHQHHSYVARGRYLEQLRCWEQFFPREQFLILSSERFFADPGATLIQVCEFLEIAPIALADYPIYNSRLQDLDGSVLGDGVGQFDVSVEGRSRLTAMFRSANRALFQYLGEDFGWAV